MKDLFCFFRRDEVLPAAGCEAQPHSTDQESDPQRHNLACMAKACLHAKLSADHVRGGVMWCR